MTEEATTDDHAVEDVDILDDDKLDKMMHIVEVLATEVEDLGIGQSELSRRLAEIGQTPPTEPQFPEQLRPWTRGPRTTTDWDLLVAWVDEIAAAHAVAGLPPCWPAHERLVLELEAARSAWYEAAAIHATKPTSAMWSWYAYTWHPLRRTLDDWDSCRTGHQPDPATAATDRHYLPILPAFEAPSEDAADVEPQHAEAEQ